MPQRVDRQPDRPQRRRQDDVLQHAHRAYTPTSGEVTFDGIEIAGLPPHRVTALGIARTFQNIRLFQTMSSLENVMVGMHCRTKGGVVRSILRTPGIRREERESRGQGARDAPLRRPRPRRWTRTSR